MQILEYHKQTRLARFNLMTIELRLKFQIVLCKCAICSTLIKEIILFMSKFNVKSLNLKRKRLTREFETHL